MATTIKLKNSVTATNAPSSLVQGEVAINVTDKKVWVGNAATTPIQLLGDGASASFGALSCTTLSASGVATFSAGTVSAPAITTTGDTNTGIFFPAADTIAFTEGGAERMRIDSSGNVGIGTSSPATLLSLAANNTGAENNTLRFWDTATNTTANQQIGKIEFYSSDTSSPGAGVKSYIGAFATDGTPDAYLAFATADGAAQATERMRIDNSGQVGIGGTPTASVTLDVSKVVGIGQSTAYGIWSRGAAAPTSTTNVSNFVATTSTSANGGTPYTTGTIAGFRAIQGTFNADSTVTNQFGFEAQSTIIGATNNFGFYSNIASGTGRWNFYANGTADNYFAGNVGIGTSSPAAKLYVNANNATATQILQDETNGAKLRCITNSINVDFGNSGGGGYLAVSGAYPLTFSTNSSERMRIDSSGNVGIGTSSPASVLHVSASTASARIASTGANGSYLRFYSNNQTTVPFEIGQGLNTGTDNVGYVWNIANAAMSFGTNSAERMRIDTSGNLLVGTTSASNGAARLDVVAPTGNNVSATLKNDAGAGQWNTQIWNAGTTGNNAFIQFATETSYTGRGSIDYNRTAGLVRYNTTSDATLKNIIGDSDGQKSVDILKSTKIREFAWKDDAEQKPQIGVIAQELYETYKGAVSVGGNIEKTDDEGNVATEYKPWGVDKTAFTFHLIAGWQAHEKLIQELKAELDSVKAELQTLKGN
jgi:hypothetical protein